MFTIMPHYPCYIIIMTLYFHGHQIYSDVSLLLPFFLKFSLLLDIKYLPYDLHSPVAIPKTWIGQQDMISVHFGWTLIK